MQRSSRARTIRRPRSVARVAMLAAWLAIASSCTNSHEPADTARRFAEGNPREPFRWPRASYRTPDECLATIEDAIESKSNAGAAAYARAFSDPDSRIGRRTLEVVHDPAVLANWQAATQVTPPEWDLDRERAVPTYLFGIRPTYRYDLVWALDPSAPVDEADEVAKTVTLHRRYTLSATPANGGVPDSIAIGSCDVSLERFHGRWSIFRWVDHVDPAVGVVPANPDQRCFTWWRLASLLR